MILLVNLWKQTWLPFYHLLVSSGLWLFHHPLCRLLLHGSLLWCFFFSPGICLQLPLFLPQLTWLGWIHVQNPSSLRSSIHLPAGYLHLEVPYLCFKSTKSQMGPPAHLPTSTKIASYISVPWIYWLRGRLHFLLSHTKYRVWSESPLIFKLFLSSPFHLTFFRSLKSVSSHFISVRPPWSQHSYGLLQKSLNWPRSSTFRVSLGTFPGKTREAFYDQPLLTPPSITYATHSTMYLHQLFLLPIMPSHIPVVLISKPWLSHYPWTLWR